MNDAIKEIEKDNYILKIYYDDLNESPREWDNITKMICFHNIYELGDKHNIVKDNFDSWNELEEYLKTENDIAIIKPLYLYDHSGITISTSPFSCKWDSHQIGFIFITNDTIKKEFINYGYDKTQKELDTILESEVDTYDKYIRGEVYGFTLEKINHCDKCNCDSKELIDSCSGFYDIKDMISQIDMDNNELLEYFKNELDNI